MTKDKSEAHRIIYGLLPDHEIRRCIHIEPFSEEQKRPGVISYGVSSYGYDIRLGRKYKVYSPVYGDMIIDPKNVQDKCFVDIEADYCVIPSNSYVLAESLEYLEIPRDVMCICLGKSTYARAGLIANITPLEPEWKGKITLEISNSSPLPAKIYSEEGIVQILFFRTMSECTTSYADKRGKYDNQKGLTLPKVDGSDK